MDPEARTAAALERIARFFDIALGALIGSALHAVYLRCFCG
ncbi:hypothetical protein [Gemmata sp.]